MREVISITDEKLENASSMYVTSDFLTNMLHEIWKLTLGQMSHKDYLGLEGNQFGVYRITVRHSISYR